jgi:hypothetical protein
MDPQAGYQDSAVKEVDRLTGVAAPQPIEITGKDGGLSLATFISPMPTRLVISLPVRSVGDSVSG